MKTYSTIKLITIDGETHSFHDYRHANSIEEAEMFCNPDYNERVVGEVIREEQLIQGNKESFH